METLEKLRNGIDQLPKWLLLVLVIFVDGLVGGLSISHSSGRQCSLR